MAHGQTVTSADRAEVQVVVGRDEAGFSSCGVRAMPMMLSAGAAEVYDFSIVIYRKSFLPLIKAGRYELNNKDSQRKPTHKVVMPAPVKFWVASATEGVPLMATKLMLAETPGFILGYGDLALSWESILSIANGNLTHVVIRAKKDSYDHVVAFSAKMQPPDLDSLNACLDSLLSKARQDANAGKDEKKGRYEILPD